MSSNLYALYSAFRFSVEINDIAASFKIVKGIKLASAFQPLQVGGMNDGPVMLPMPNKEMNKITFERGKYTSKDCKLPVPGTKLQSLCITVSNEDESSQTVYTLSSPVIESVELGTLDALSSEVLIETLTVAFSHITEQ